MRDPRLPMMAPGAVYKHVRCLDLCLYILKGPYACSDGAKVRVRYVNEEGMLYAAEPETVVIKTEEYNNWKRVG